MDRRRVRGPDAGEGHYVGRLDWSAAAVPPELAASSTGLAVVDLVGPPAGAVHTDLSSSRLRAGGGVSCHVHSIEKAVYLLSGSVVLCLDGHRHLLREGDFALVPVGTWHSFSNPGDVEATWLTLATPQRRYLSHSAPHTLVPGPSAGFPPGGLGVPGAPGAPGAPDAAAGRHGGTGSHPPDPFDPTVSYVGHYGGTPPQAETLAAVLAAGDAAGDRAPSGMDTALRAYSGISVKPMVDRAFGAELLTMFMVDYEVGGAAEPHDHPFEEAYFFLEGRISAEVDGHAYELGPGDILFAAVGSTHAFSNTGKERVRWIETQAPQPPQRHAYRWVTSWRRLGDSPAVHHAASDLARGPE